MTEIKVKKNKDGTITLKSENGTATLPEATYLKWLRNPKHTELPPDARHVVDEKPGK